MDSNPSGSITVPSESPTKRCRDDSDKSVTETTTQSAARIWNSQRQRQGQQRRNDHDRDDDDNEAAAVLSGLTQRLNLYGNERERGALDIHGIPMGNQSNNNDDDNDVHDGDREANEIRYREQFLDEMDKCISSIVETQPDCALAKAMTMNEQYVLSQKELFLKLATSTTLRMTLDPTPPTDATTAQPIPPLEEGPDSLTKRMADFFTLKGEYFTEECLGRDILLSDLTEIDRAVWNTGYTQISREKDPAGRVVSFTFTQIRDIPIETYFRIIIYKYQIISNYSDAQQNGLVDVTYSVGSIHPAELYETAEFLEAITRFDDTVPVRARAFHIIYSNRMYEPIFRDVTDQMNIYHACRYRQHLVMSHQEAFLLLQTFGIQRDSVPIHPLNGRDQGKTCKDHNPVTVLENFFGDTTSGESVPNTTTEPLERYYIETDFHHRFLESIEKFEQNIRSESQKSKETVSAPKSGENEIIEVPSQTTSGGSTTIVLPGPMDIELGRGAIYHNRTKPGYLRYRLVLEDYFDQYEQTPRQDRVTIVNDIMLCLDQAGIRFVRPLSTASTQTTTSSSSSSSTTVSKEDGKLNPTFHWEIVPPSVIRDKITHDMRNVRKASK